jgi:hypothetical protein
MPEGRLGLDSFLLGVRREYRFFLTTFAASGIGYLGSAAAPVIVNALIETGLDVGLDAAVLASRDSGRPRREDRGRSRRPPGRRRLKFRHFSCAVDSITHCF